TNYKDYKLLAEISKGLGGAMTGLEISSLAPADRMQDRGW
ncbi:MAG: pyridoxal 5'-phosphate synthase lyase subunit PdxS, partial [Candidatus Riflebacteria bacterium]|nr:pyridoxal 5'-phosphate synthase lyase subunit PdxS [Candidatus Riflebacteria bacterium]